MMEHFDLVLQIVIVNLVKVSHHGIQQVESKPHSQKDQNINSQMSLNFAA